MKVVTGSSDLSKVKKLTSIGFGTWAWGNKILWGYLPDEKDYLLRNTFNEAIDQGLNFIDTADSYGTGSLNGCSEKLLGKFLRKLPSSKCKNLIIATKLAPYPWRLGRQAFKAAFHASKGRLQGKLDRAQLHWSTSRYAPWQEVQLIDGLADLYESGALPQIGISNMGPNRLRWFYNRLKMRGIPLKSLQIQFSLLSPNPNKHLRVKEVCKELDIELLAYSPLALGLLAIPPDKDKVIGKTFLRGNIFRRLLPASMEIRKELNKIALDHEASQAQVALNWCRAHDAIPIAGLRNPKHATDAGKATQWKLNRKEKDVLDELSKQCNIRMPDNPFQSD